MNYNKTKNSYKQRAEDRTHINHFRNEIRTSKNI